MAKKNFYAVRVGKRPGIYRTWAQAQPLVAGFSGAKYAGFTTKAAAEAFMHGAAASKQAKTAHAPTTLRYYTLVAYAVLAHPIKAPPPDDVIAFTAES